MIDNLTPYIIREGLNAAITAITPTFLIGCIEAYPVLTESEAPVVVSQFFSQHKNTFITNNGRNIYFSMANAVEYFRNVRGQSSSVWTLTDLQKEIEGYLVREYSHLFLQHARLARYYKKDEYKHFTFQLACEIEACRNNLLDRFTDCYKNSATDSVFPACAAANHLKQIYQKLLEEYDDEIEQVAQQAVGAGQQNNDGNDDGDNDSDKSVQNGQEGGSDGKNDSEPDPNGQNAQEGQNEADNDNSEKLSSPVSGKLTEQQKELVRKFAKANQEKVSPGDDANDASMDGNDPGHNDEKQDKDINKMLEDGFNRWGEKQLKKSLKNLRSAIRGTLSVRRDPTYARPSRRMIGKSELLRKGTRRATTGQPKILIALDQSGSMDKTTIEQVAQIIHNVFIDLGRPMHDCYITRFDDYCSGARPLKEWRDEVQKYSSGGGTDYGDVMGLAMKLGVDVVIEVGDGCDDLRNYSKRSAAFVRANIKWYDVLVPLTDSELKWVFGSHIRHDNGAADKGECAHRVAIPTTAENIIKYRALELNEQSQIGKNDLTK